MTLFDIDSPDHGIVHVIGPELGLTLPGTTVVCGDSHTCTNGGLGALGFGVGTSEVAHVLATQSLVQRRPAMMRIIFTGSLAPHVSPKDLILHTIARARRRRRHGLRHRVRGTADRSARRRRAHDHLQSGCRDRRQDRTRRAGRSDLRLRRLASLRAQRRGARRRRRLLAWRWSPMRAPSSTVRRTSTPPAVAPQISWGTSPAHSGPVDGAGPGPVGRPRRGRRTSMGAGDRLHGRASRAATRGAADPVVLHRLVHERAAFGSARGCCGGRGAVRSPRTCARWSFPARAAVRRAAEAEGLDRVFTAAGFEWGEAGCGLCPGLGGVTAGTGRALRVDVEPQLHGPPGRRACARIWPGRPRPRTPRSTAASPTCARRSDGARSPIVRGTGRAAAAARHQHRSSSRPPTAAKGAWPPTRSLRCATCPAAPTNPDFVLNQRAFPRGARSCSCGHNFGCGSSREIGRVVAAGDRHPVRDRDRASATSSSATASRTACSPSCCRSRSSSSWQTSRRRRADGGRPHHDDAHRSPGRRIAFPVDPMRRTQLLEGLDDIALTLRHKDEILAFQSADRLRRPWVYGSEA